MHEGILGNWARQNQLRYWLLISIFCVTLAAGLLFIKREQFGLMLTWQVLLYCLFILLYQMRRIFRLGDVIKMAILVRLAVAFIPPQLSDDIYRFIWDGQLIVNHQNPLLSTPDSLLPQLKDNAAYFAQLHGNINHPQFYTCYPPLMQLVFWVSAQLGGYSLVANMIILKLIIAITDSIAVILLARLLKKLQLPVMLVILYALNPAVIIEGAGNAHFEVMQVCCMIAAVYYSMQNRLLPAAGLWGLAIITKLLPLVLLPLWIKKLGWKRGILFSFISTGVAVIAFIPFISIDSLNGFRQSLGLYFQNFEFNASVYYVARAIGWWVKGYNYISFIGPLLMGIFLCIYAVIFFASRKADWYRFSVKVIWVLTLYYALATTVHPWYMINLLPFAILTGKRFPLVWCGVAFLSYHAYANTAFKENLWLTGIEYAIVIAAIIYEWRKSNDTKLNDGASSSFS
jgi:alpha-1,6-mannosyltransferase